MTTLSGKVAVVAGATRGAGRGLARALGEAGATVYCTGRSVRGKPSPYQRPETIEETAEQVAEAGGTGIPVRMDHSREVEVAELFARVKKEQRGKLDILVDSVAGEDPTFSLNQPLWETDFERGVEIIRQAVLSHMFTAKHALKLMIPKRGGLVVQVTDRNTFGYGGMGFLHDFVKESVMRLAYVVAEEGRKHHITAVSVMPGYLRSEAMLAHFGVTEENWRAGGKKDKHFLESESPLFVGRAVAALAADPRMSKWSGEATSSAELGAHYGVTDYDGRRPDFITYFAEHLAPQMGKEMFEKGIEWQGRALERAKRYLGAAAPTGSLTA